MRTIRNRRARLGAWVAGLIALSSGPAAQGAVTYGVTDLGTLGGGTSYAQGVNAGGRVVGYAYTTGNTPDNNPLGYHAFRAAGTGAMDATADLGTLGGSSSGATAINATGQVVGWSYTVGISNPHAFRIAAGASITAGSDLGTLGGTESHAQAINASGQVAGNSYLKNNGVLHAFRTTATGTIDSTTDLGTLGGSNSSAEGMNDSGQVVGRSDTAGNASSHAFRTTSTGVIDLTTDLGTLGGTNSYARAVNASGQVVGNADVTGVISHAFRTTATGVITAASDLGTLGGSVSTADGINTNGETVGVSYLSDDRTQHAFYVAAAGNTMVDLNTLIPSNSGWVLTEATGINDAGQIVGFGTLGGQTHAFILTAPEPTGLSLACVGIATAILRRRRR